jgi:protein involved in plasmid replication-relaxation
MWVQALAATEVYVRLIEALRGNSAWLAEWHGEPTCWRHFQGAYGQRLDLKPDAYVRVQGAGYSDTFFVEVDTGSQSRSVIFYALAGYLVPEGLPELRPYLRAKYGLHDRAARQLDEYFQALRYKWSEGGESSQDNRGDQNRSVLGQVRDLAPHRALTPGKSRQIIERQATRLLRVSADA